MSRKKIIAGNWKMNLDVSQAVKLASDIKQINTMAELAVFPSFVFLAQVQQALVGSAVSVGAQNCSNFDNGAYTGEVSAAMLASIQVKYVLIGHSERREYFGETNEVLKLKMESAIAHGLKPVFCCGEPLTLRKEGAQEDFVLKQLQESLFSLGSEQMQQITIAYEPVWAIGTGLTASAEQAQQMHAFIRSAISNRYGAQIADEIRILYGGSCKPDNAAALFACADVDGGLIGGASLKAADFASIAAAV